MFSLIVLPRYYGSMTLILRLNGNENTAQCY